MEVRMNAVYLPRGQQQTLLTNLQMGSKYTPSPEDRRRDRYYPLTKGLREENMLDNNHIFHQA